MVIPWWVQTASVVPSIMSRRSFRGVFVAGPWCLRGVPLVGPLCSPWCLHGVALAVGPWYGSMILLWWVRGDSVVAPRSFVVLPWSFGGVSVAGLCCLLGDAVDRP